MRAQDQRSERSVLGLEVGGSPALNLFYLHSCSAGAQSLWLGQCRHQALVGDTVSPLGQGPSSLEETPQGCLCAPAACTHGGPSVTSPQEGPHSLCVSVLEAPDLHGGHQEILRAEWLVVEGVTVARAATVQVPVDEERLAAPSTCRRH